MNDRYYICESHTGMSFRLITNPANNYDTKMNSGAIVTAVSFCLKAADMIREALPAELKIKNIMSTTWGEVRDCYRRGGISTTGSG